MITSKHIIVCLLVLGIAFIIGLSTMHKNYTPINCEEVTPNNSVVESKQTSKKNKKKRKKYKDEYYDYLTIGCSNQQSRNNINMKNIQLACTDNNNLTSENYYRDNFKYPVIPFTSEHDMWIPSNYVDTNYMAKAYIYYKISDGKKPSGSVPHAANYIF
jgi:hypothetical protein